MTRDEARKIYCDAVQFADSEFVGNLIVAFEKLGMLKLDEPKSCDVRLSEELGWPENGGSYRELVRALNRAGLKLIEK